MNPVPPASEPVQIFVAYARRDAALKDELIKHLAGLRGQGRLVHWHDQQIAPGSEWDGEIKRRLDEADIVLLLVSHYFLASDYCASQEVPRAIARHKAGTALVIPVIIRDCHWQVPPLSALQGLPRDGMGIAGRRNRDRTFAEVAREIDKLLQGLEPPQGAAAVSATRTAPPLSTARLFEGYCVHCRKRTVMVDPKEVKMKNGKPATQGVCPECGTKMFKIGKSK
jgi:TIR domain/Domain of unknown function (DUF5679)